MPSPASPPDTSDDAFTLLGVRRDGVASVVDLVPSESLETVRQRAAWLLEEHASCHLIEVWRGGALVEELARA